MGSELRPDGAELRYDEYDEFVEMSVYALTRRRRRQLWTVLVVSITAVMTLSVCDDVFGIRLTIPALLFMTVANLCAASLMFARRMVPVHQAFRYGYKSGREDERIYWVGDGVRVGGGFDSNALEP